MSLLARLTWGRCAHAVSAALDAAGAHGGRVLVLGAPGLARVLGQRGRDVAAAGEGENLPLADDELAGLVAVSRAEPRDEWLRVVRPGGALVLVASIPEAEMSRRALCAGLVELAARRSGRLVVMSGRVWKPRSAPGR